MTIKSKTMAKELDRDAIRAAMQKAINSGDNDAYMQAFDDLCEYTAHKVDQDFSAAIDEMRQETDRAIMAKRGQKQLTSEEHDYFQSLLTAMRSDRPRNALENLDKTFPVTVFETVFDNLRTEHELLSKIDFRNAAGNLKMLYSTDGYQEAQWGELCDEIVRELSGGFATIDVMSKKLSAFIVTCKPGMEIGPDWLARYVIEVLQEAFANGLEAGIVNGSGANGPIGMMRDVGPDAQVVGGAYPEKAAITVTDMDAQTLGRIVRLMALTESGKPKKPGRLMIVVNPYDYYGDYFAATHIRLSDGGYVSALPFGIETVQSVAVPIGKAILGVGSEYFAAIAYGKDGKVESSDHAMFVEDKRVSIVKGYGNGRPKNNRAFQVLDISNLNVLTQLVTNITKPTPSADATLSSLKIGNLALSPSFASVTDTYTAATTAATNTVTAVMNDASASIAITVNDEPLPNGTAATWETGENVVVITVTAGNGTTTKPYTVTVTKS